MKLINIIFNDTTVYTCSAKVKVYGKAQKHLAFVVASKREAQCLSTLNCVTFATIERKQETKGYLLNLTFDEQTKIEIKDLCENF